LTTLCGVSGFFFFPSLISRVVVRFCGTPFVLAESPVFFFSFMHFSSYLFFLFFFFGQPQPRNLLPVDALIPATAVPQDDPLRA